MTLPLTADICARAIVAAARCYGDDPVAAMSPIAYRGTKSRRCVTPAALAIVQATGCSRPRLWRILGIDYYNLTAVPKKSATAAPWRAALDALGVDPTSIQPPRFGPKAKVAKAKVASDPVVAPPVAQPSPPALVVDHRPAIAEAMARRRARGDVAFSVAGVDTDMPSAARSEGTAFSTRSAADALIGATEAGGCVWPMGDPREADYRSCQATPLSGRIYCAEHLKKAGMKPVAKVIQTVGRVAEAYVDREAG